MSNHNEPRSKESKQQIQQRLKHWKLHAGNWLQIAVGLSMCAGLAIIFQAWLLANIITDVIFQEQTLEHKNIQWLLTLLLLTFLIRSILAWAAEQAAFNAAAKVKTHLRNQLYQHIQKLGPSWLTNERSGDVVNSLSDGIEGLEAYYARYLPAMSVISLLPLTILVFVFAHDWLAALIMLLTAPLIPIFMILIGKGTEKRNQQQWKTLARMSAHFLDVIQGLTTLKLFNASRQEANMIARISNEYKERTMSVLRIAFLSSFMLEFLASVSIALVAVSIGFRLFWGEIDFYYGFFVLLLAPEFYLPLRNLGTQYHARMEAIGAADRIIDILDTPIPNQPITSNKQFISNIKQTDIVITDLSYRYPDQRQALDHINLTIKAGESIAIIGESGAGKTTLTHLMMGFLPIQQGNISLRQAAEEYTLTAIPIEYWRQQIAWLPQRPQIFPSNVAENIALGDDTINESLLGNIQQAAKKAYIHDFIETLPNGYQTLIGEGGHGLSGGQKQRIALARVFLKQAPIVFLDEATANLDRHSETLIEKSLQTLRQESTLIMVAHRLQTIQQANHIVIMKNGKITATGTHNALSQHNLDYKAMLKASISSSTLDTETQS